MTEQEQKLRDEILADAGRKAERARAKAQRDAEKARKQAETDQQAERAALLARAAERGAAQSRSILVTVAQEVRRRRLLARETVIERCLDEALDAADGLAGDELDRSLGELLAEALAALGDGPVLVRVAPGAAGTLSPERLAALGIDPARLTVIPDEALGGGLVAESPEGARRFDNTYATRRERLRERLRTLLAGDIEF